MKGDFTSVHFSFAFCIDDECYPDISTVESQALPPTPNQNGNPTTAHSKAGQRSGFRFQRPQNASKIAARDIKTPLPRNFAHGSKIQMPCTLGACNRNSTANIDDTGAE